MLKANVLLRIRSKFKDTINLSDFCEETRDIWDMKFYEIINMFVSSIHKLICSAEFFEEKAKDKETKHQKSKDLSFIMINLSMLMLTIGCNFDIEGNLKIHY